MDYVQGEHREQLTMFPEALEDYIDPENPVRFIDAFVDNLDLASLGFTHSELKETGRPPYNPGDLLKLYLYGYLNRIRTSRTLEREAVRNLEVMWLLKKLRPDDRTICSFRRDNAQALKKTYRSFHQICKKLQLFSEGLVAVDGSKFKASNSGKRNYSKKGLDKSLEKIDKHIEDYLAELDRNDTEDQEKSGKLKREELQSKLQQLRELQAKYKDYTEELEATGETQKSLTDRDSRLMKTPKGFDVCQNVQVAADSKHNLVVEFYPTSEECDQNELEQICTLARDALGVEELEALADGGYVDHEQIKKCEEDSIRLYLPIPAYGDSNVPDPDYKRTHFTYDQETDCYRCPAEQELFYSRTATYRGKRIRVYRTPACNQGCPHRAQCTTGKRGRTIHRWEHEEVIERVEQRVAKQPDKLPLRKQIVEPVFGTIKHAMGQGTLLLRGIEKVTGELSLTMLAYNIRRVISIVGITRMIAAVTP